MMNAHLMMIHLKDMLGVKKVSHKLIYLKKFNLIINMHARYFFT